MKKSIFRFLAVMVTTLSVAFLGTSIVAWVVYPEPLSEMSSPLLQDYTFEDSGGASRTWTVTRRVGDKGSVGSGLKSAHEAVLKAYQDLASRSNQESSAAGAELQRLRDPAGELAMFRAAQEQDTAAMRAQMAELQTLSGQYTAQLLQKSEELQALAVQSKSIRDETAARRTDVVRLQHELEEARTDLFRLNESIRTLTDQVVRLQLENQSLSDRRNQLQGQLR